MASCRVDNGWSDPAYFDLKGGSFGLQIGAQATDFVLLFMNHDGIKSLLKNKFEMGGDASVAAGEEVAIDRVEDGVAFVEQWAQVEARL